VAVCVYCSQPNTNKYNANKNLYSAVIHKNESEAQPINNKQWLKCNGTQRNAVPPPTIYGSNRSLTSDCYNARERHTIIVRVGLGGL